MKLYCKIKKDGKWCWYVGDSPWKIHVARKLCECRVCCLVKPNIVCQEDDDWETHEDEELVYHSEDGEEEE